MRGTSPSGAESWFKTLSVLSDRYLTADIHGARSALIESEALLRATAPRIPQSGFALAVVLAKRSEIEACLGDHEVASTSLGEALRLFQSEPLGIRGGLTTTEAIRKFVRQQEASGVKWREAYP